MSTARWTDETLELVASNMPHPQGGSWSRMTADERALWYDRAGVVLFLLADAGLLLEPGGETRTEWGCRHFADQQTTRLAGDESYVQRHVATLRENGHSEACVMSRTVYTGPWRPADTQEEP